MVKSFLSQDTDKWTDLAELYAGPQEEHLKGQDSGKENHTVIKGIALSPPSLA